jgi:hypothetical protein
MTELPVIDVHAARTFLSKLSPDIAWLLHRIEDEEGYLRFPPEVNDAIKRLRIEVYPRLYENEAAIGSVFIRGFLSHEEIREFAAELEAATPEERGAWLLGFVEDLTDGGVWNVIPKTPGERRRAAEAFEALSADEQASAVKFAQHSWMSLLASFHQILSSMVHGERLTSLVARAKLGDDQAFAKAVQIDKRILFAVPFFKDRFERANFEGETDFIDALTYRLRCAPYKGKIRHKMLWAAFAYLDMCGLLWSMPHAELLDLLEDVGMAGFPNRIEDVKNLSKRLKEYREFQSRSASTSSVNFLRGRQLGT